MAEDGPTYKSFLLRLWQEDTADAPWRASLERITQREEKPHHFPDVESLITFLLAELNTKQAPPAFGYETDEDG
jgi:hypothetical protein